MMTADTRNIAIMSLNEQQFCGFRNVSKVDDQKFKTYRKNNGFETFSFSDLDLQILRVCCPLSIAHIFKSSNSSPNDLFKSVGVLSYFFYWYCASKDSANIFGFTLSIHSSKSSNDSSIVIIFSLSLSLSLSQ